MSKLYPTIILLSFLMITYQFVLLSVSSPNSIRSRLAFASLRNFLYVCWSVQNVLTALKIYVMSKGNMLMNTALGKLGSMVLYRANGSQRARTYLEKIKNPKTSSQMTQRVQLANLVNFYRSLRVVMEKSFSDKKVVQSDYNAFVSKNLNKVKVYLTSAQADAKYTIVAPYQISSGVLSPIVTSGSGDSSVTNISVGNLTSINASTTVGDLSRILVENNNDIINGMALSYISVVQLAPENSLPARVVVNMYKMQIDVNSSELVYDYLPPQAIAIVNGYIGHGAHIASGGFCWILSRKNADGSLQVSPQSLIMSDSEMYDYYSSDAQASDAIVSYGAQADVFLDPNSVVSAQNAPLASVASVAFNNSIIWQRDTPYENMPLGTSVAISGTNLDSSRMQIMTSSAGPRLTDAQILAAAVPLASYMTVRVQDQTNILGATLAETGVINQVAIIQDGWIVFYRIIDQEAPEPTSEIAVETATKDVEVDVTGKAKKK